MHGITTNRLFSDTMVGTRVRPGPNDFAYSTQVFSEVHYEYRVRTNLEAFTSFAVVFQVSRCHVLSRHRSPLAPRLPGFIDFNLFIGHLYVSSYTKRAEEHQIEAAARVTQY